MLEDDQIFLHVQERLLAQAGNKPYAQACYLPTQADRYVLALRQWVSQFQADPFPGQALPPMLSKEVLLERYHSHTKHCASCRGALQRIQQIRLVALVISAVLWSSIPLAVALLGPLSLPLGAALTGLPLVAGGLWLWLGKVERDFYQGAAVPPRNLPDKR